MKEFNGIVRVGETADIEKAVEMPFSEVLKLPSFKGEGRGRKPIYNFICFDSKYNRKSGFYEKEFIKICLESWKKRFPLSRYIFINVEDCFEVSLWSKETYEFKSYPTDSLRLYFTSLLDNCFYFDTDVYIGKEAKLPLSENEFIYIATGTLWNKKRNNKKLECFFSHYEEKAKKLLQMKSHNEKYNFLNHNTDYDMYIDSGSYKKIKNVYKSSNVFIPIVHFACFVYCWDIKYSYFLNIERNKRRNYPSVIPNEAFWGMMIYCIEKRISNEKYVSDYFSIITNSNRFYVKVENGVPIGVSFDKKDGYNISYSNRLFWDWIRYYKNNELYKNIKFENKNDFFYIEDAE
jgi:hypothetical protein